MVNCQIKYDNQGNILTVYDKAGNESRLFLSIAKLPMVKNMEEALEIYKQTYAKGISDNAEIVIEGVFKSNLREALANIKDKNVKNVKGWVNQLNDFDKTGVRYTNQEMEWIGLEDFLKDWVEENKPKNGNIPFDVVDQYVKDNQIEIKDVVKGGSLPKLNFEKSRYVDNEWSAEDITGTFSSDYIIRKISGGFELETADGFITEHNSFEDAVEIADEHITANQIGGLEGQTRYTNYTLEGGENQREILLTLPKKEILVDTTGWTAKRAEGDPASGEIWEVRDKNGVWVLGIPVNSVEGKEGAIREASNTVRQPSRDSSNNYQSSHWDEINVLAHIRLNERTLPNGEKVLFVEEIQSDWAQDGKKNGFDNPEQEEKYKQNLKDAKRFTDIDVERRRLREELIADKELTKARELLKERGYFIGVNFKGDNKRYVYDHPPTRESEGLNWDSLPTEVAEAVEMIDQKSEKMDALENEREALIQKYGVDGSDRFTSLNIIEKSGQGIPDMPYKKTDQWVGMSFRKVMQMASQEGFDRVAWVTGEQSAQRYDLSKQVDRMTYRKEDGQLWAFSKGSSSPDVINTRGISEEQLESYVGKEVAKKLLEAEATSEGYQSLEGEELEVGGEGMKAFYNQILPKVALKEAQRFDKKSKIDVVDFTKQPLKVIKREGKKILINNKSGEVVDSQYGDRFNTDEEYIDAFIDGFRNSEGITISDKGISKQLSIKITPRAKASLIGAVPLFSKNNSTERSNTPQEVVDAVVSKLKRTGLAKSVEFMSQEELGRVLDSIGVNKEIYFNMENRGNQVMEFGATKIYYKQRENPITGQKLPGIELDLITTDVSERGKGSAKAAMAEFVKFADQTGQKIYAIVSPRDSSTQASGIEKLNLDNGFVYTSDFEMERKPRKVKNSINKGVQGFVYNDKVYINKDGVSPLNTAIHEFGHLWNSWAKKNTPDVYDRGIELIKEQGQDYIEFVKENQPTLEGEAIYEEALAKAIGDNGEMFVKQQAKDSFKDWLKSLWEAVKETLGITQYTSEQLLKLNLDDFAKAIAVDMMKGNSFGTSLKSEIEQIKENALEEGTFMKAPNGKDTNLNERQWLQVRTQNFKNWFGDWQNDPQNASKVVDENGEPMVVYHGTEGTFNKFKKQKSKRWIMFHEYEVEADAFFFTPKKKAAKKHGKDVIPVFLNLRYQADIDYYENIEEFLPKDSGVTYDNYLNTAPWQVLEMDGMVDNLREEYDGAFFSDEVGGTEHDTYAVFDANQIKSAEENTGEFSLENNDIRFSVDSSKPEWKYTTEEVSRVKDLDKGVEDGATMNLDGSKYTGGGLVVPVDSVNLTQEALTNEAIQQFLEKNKDKIGSDIVKFGLYKFKNSPQVSVDLSIVIPIKNREVALEFGRLAGQESLYNLETGEYEFTGADGKNPRKFNSDEFREIASSLSKGVLPTTVGGVADGNKLFNDPLEETLGIAIEYMESRGLTHDRFEGVSSINKGLSKVISDLFENMEESNSPEVLSAYRKMVEETIDQYEIIVSKGYTVEVNNSEPYSSSGEMISDLRNNKNMKIFSTEEGFGDTPITEEQRKNNPLLQKTEFVDKNGVPLLANDLFRFVHDFFGHSELGNGFGPVGEENAWQVHARMYSKEARRAMTTETRGQNSWVNFSGVNDAAFEKTRKARRLRAEGRVQEASVLTGEVYSEMKFADQKVGLLPEWVSDPYADLSFSGEHFNKLSSKEQASVLGYTLNKEGSKIVDKEGKFKYERRTSVSLRDVVDTSLMNEHELKLIDYWGNTPIKMYGGRNISEGIAMYNNSTKEISINVNNGIGEVVFSNQENVNRAILHEIIHHIVNTKVQDKEGLYSELEGIRKQIVKNKSLASPYVQNIIGHIENGSVEEVLTYTLTDKALAEFLNSVKAETQEKDSLWSRIVKAIVSALKGDSLLSSIVNVMDKYTDSLDSTFDYSEGNTGTNYMQVIEPELSIKGSETFKDALDKEEDIEIGVDTRDGFKTLLTIPYNVNPETRDGFINKYIKEGFLKEETIIKNGKKYFETSGINYLDRKGKEIMLEDDLVTMLGAERSEVKDGLIEIKEEIEKYNYTDQDRAIIKDLVSELFKSNNVGLRRNTAPKKLNGEELKLKLMTLLNKLGVETMSISEYVEKYNKKNGVDPSVRALADAVNRVVAFKDGLITLEDLTEEVMHIIVETLPEAEIEGILRNIHRTTEYSQHSQQYRDAYSNAYPKLDAQQIENLVRKEILGKVLKNSTLANMEQTDQRNFYEKALDYIKGFFERINGGREFQDQLKEINKKIEELFIQENLTDYLDNNLNSNAFPMYSINGQASGDSVLDLARGIQKSMLNSLKQSYLAIDKRFGALYADKVRAQKLEEMIDNVTQAAAASDFLGLIKRQADFVKRAVETAKNEDTALSIEARQVLINLNDSLRALLERQRDVTNRLTPEQLGLKAGNTSEAEAQMAKKALVSKIDDMLAYVGNVSGEASNILDTTFDDILERIAVRHDLSPEKREFLRSQSEMMNTEIGFFMETFGQLIHSSDVLLNVAANVVEEMWGKHTTLTQKRFRKFAKAMEDNGVGPQELTKLFDRGFVLSQYDFPKFKEKMKEVELNIYNTIFGDATSQEDYDKMKEEGTLKRYDDAQHNTAQRMRSEALSDLVEKRMNSKYYEDQAKKYEALGISKFTIDQLKALSLQRAIVQEAATDDSGKVIYTESNKDDLDALSQTRKEYKSIVDSFGTLKKGFIEMPKEQATARGIDIYGDSNDFLEIGNLIYTLSSDASNEAKLSYELHLIDKDYKKNSAKRNMADFVDKFVEISNEQGLEQGIKFVENNVGISFSTEFWDSMTTENILDNVDVNLIPGNPAIIKRIRQKRNRLSQLKKLYQDPMNPQEVKGYEMNISEQEVIKNLVEEIEIEMDNLVMPEEMERPERPAAESDINQSYRDALSKEVKNELSKEEFKFIRNHLTSKNESYLISLESKAKALDEGRYNGSEKTKLRLEAYMQEDDTYYNAFVRLSRTKLLPYYRRFTPEGYKTIKEVTSELSPDDIKQIRIIDYISQLEGDPNYEVNIHYTFDAASEDVNPNWDKDFRGGFDQPKLSSFLNQKFVDMFDPEIVNGKFTGTVRKNQQLYNVQQALLEMQEENLESIGQKGSANVYKVPQISRTRVNQISDFFKKSNKGATLKEMFKDTFNYRVDDLEYGNEENNATLQRASDTRTIPTFYTRDLENSEDVTDDLFYSYLAMTNQSVLHQVRRNGIIDIRAVEAKMLSRENPHGKAAQVTRNYKMLKSYMDYNYYGVKESTSYKVKLPIINKEVDLTKILRQLNNYVKLRNLGLNFIVPFTSFITAEVNTQIEATLGEYFSRDSLRLASREFGKLFKETGFVKNSLSYNDKSKLNILGEWLGVYDMSEKSANAKYSTMMRWFAKSGMALHQLGNFPVIPRIFLSIMFDNRIVDGKFISRKQFLEGKADKKSAISEWKTYEGNALYHYLDIKETGVELKPELLEDLNGDQEYLDIKMQAIRSLIKDQVEKIDGMIPESQRVEAQRNAVFNYLMTHRGWLAIGAQKRLKGLQLNLETGQMEEGTYITMKNLLFDFLGGVGGGQDKTWNLIKAMKKAYEGAKNERDPELVKRNLKRMGVEFVFLTGIVTVLAAITAMADDDENKDLYALQLTNYFLWRLANETSSNQLGVFTELAGVVQSPIVGYQQVEDLANIAMIFDDEYTSGTYKGHSGAYKYFFKNTVGLKSLHDLKNIRNTEKNYVHYNRANIDFSSMGIFSLMNDA